VEGAIREYESALNPNYAVARSSLAWSHINPADRGPDRPVNWAKRAVDLAIKERNHRNTLGLALYRAGDWKEALTALEKSMELRKGGDSFDWFFLAMAHDQLGDKKKAREWYDRATRWMDKNQAANEELRRFRAEAGQVLGVDKRTN
jgi:tetratricopeptide (TPR) repeat protein